jgi:hypothetical protein
MHRRHPLARYSHCLRQHFVLRPALLLRHPASHKSVGPLPCSNYSVKIGLGQVDRGDKRAKLDINRQLFVLSESSESDKGIPHWPHDPKHLEIDDNLCVVITQHHIPSLRRLRRILIALIHSKLVAELQNLESQLIAAVISCGLLSKSPSLGPLFLATQVDYR